MKKKKQKIFEVLADWKDLDGLVESFTEAINGLGGHVEWIPSYEDSDMVGLFVSAKKMTKKEINENDSGICEKRR